MAEATEQGLAVLCTDGYFPPVRYMQPYRELMFGNTPRKCKPLEFRTCSLVVVGLSKICAGMPESTNNPIDPALELNR